MVIVFVAAVLPVLVGLIVFVVDTGNWWVHKRHLQLQADAAAIAGGDLFGECFSNPANAYTDMKSEASRYAGVAGSSFNGQVGNANKGSLAVLYNSATFSGQASTSNPPNQTPDDTVAGDACTSQAFDVKMTESNLPLFFGGFAGFNVVKYVNAHARVKLFQAKAGKGGFPLAVPDIIPKQVAVTFVDMANPGVPLAGCAGSCTFQLTSSGLSNGLSMWTGTATIPVSNAYTDIGVRVGLGSAVGSCAGTGGVSGQYICYDNNNSSTALVVIRGYKTSGTGAANAPLERAVWETTSGCGVNTGSPFFADASGQSSCNAFVQAKVDFGSAVPKCPQVCISANGQQMTFASGIWSKTFSIPLANGATPATLTWSNTNFSTCGNNGKQKCQDQPFPTPPDQQAYGADSDPGTTGPVELVSLSDSSGKTGAPYALDPGTHTLTVTVGLQGGLASLAVPSPTTLLRLQVNTSKSITTAVQCDPGGNNAFAYALQNGCQTPYQLNPTGSCSPDPAPPGPADCTPTRNGNLGGTVGKALNDRFGCPANNWPSYPVTDPRLVQMMLTDFSGLIGSGKTLVPVDNFATFYVTGWDGGASCKANEARPFPGKKNDGDIWGHFVKFSNPADTGGGITCSQPGNNVIPCVPELIR